MSTHTNPAGLTGRRTLKSRVARMGAAAVGVATIAVIGGALPAHASAGTVGTHYRSSATCRPISSPVVGAPDTISVQAPTIYAANTTSGQDAQFVGFRQRVMKWTGSAWVNTGQASAVYKGFATDSRAALDFQDPQGRTFRMPAFDLMAAQGYQAVVTDYYWFSGNTLTGSDSAWAYHSNNNPTSYCTFRY